MVTAYGEPLASIWQDAFLLIADWTDSERATILAVSEGCCTALGYDRAALEGQPWRSLLVGGSELRDRAFADCGLHGRTFRFEATIRQGDGRSCSTTWYGAPVAVDAQGQRALLLWLEPLHGHGSEAAACSGKGGLAAALGGEDYRLAGTFACLHSPDGSYHYVSLGLAQRLGCPAAALVGQPPGHWIDPRDRDRVRLVAGHPIVRGEKLSRSLYRLRPQGGELLWFETDYRPLWAENGRLLGIFSISQDVTDRISTARMLAWEDCTTDLLMQLSAQVHRDRPIEPLLQGLVDEVDRLLMGDRVAIYRHQGQGQFQLMADSAGATLLVEPEALYPRRQRPETSAATPDAPPSPPHLILAAAALQGYCNGQVFTLDDRTDPDHRTPEGTNLLEAAAAHCALVVPILKPRLPPLETAPVTEPDPSRDRGRELWGLLGLFSIQPPCIWSAEEVNVLRKVAGHVELTLTHADLLRTLRTSQESYALAVHAANDALWDWDLDTHQVYYSPRWQTLLGYGDAELSTWEPPWLPLVHPNDRVRFQAALEAHLSGRSESLEGEYRLKHRDGTYQWMLCRGVAARDRTGRPHRMAGSISDIQARKRAEAQLLHDALHDALTGLPNRALFFDRLGQALAGLRRRSGRPFAILCLDLDRFKLVNDGLGHLTGDRLLMDLAERLQTCVGPDDTVARLSGDEFAILLVDLGSDRVPLQVAAAVQQTLRTPFSVDGHALTLTASIGITYGQPTYSHPGELLRDADLAMYRAKELGGARYAVFDRAMHERALARLELERDLRLAIERDELLLEYQPLVDLYTGQLIGVEALVRWQHPSWGRVSPDRFIPVAEETGEIVPLGEWVLRTVGQQWRSWWEEVEGTGDRDRLRRMEALTVNVNLSGRQFGQPDLGATIHQLLAETRMPPRCLKLEITESAVMADAKRAVKVMARFRELGIGLAIDDFGTGYSSLSYLQRLPVDTLKVDRSFVSEDPTPNHGDWAIVRAVGALAASLGLKVVAEGVEQPWQVARLRHLGCAYGQGFAFARSLPADQILPLMDHEFEAVAIANGLAGEEGMLGHGLVPHPL